MIERLEEPMRVEAMGIRPADRLVLDRNDPQIDFHLHRDREFADRLEKRRDLADRTRLSTGGESVMRIK